jgi:hypothetical protein
LSLKVNEVYENMFRIRNFPLDLKKKYFISTNTKIDLFYRVNLN